MKKFLQKLLNKHKIIHHHFGCVAKKDKSGRIRYKFYIDGKLCKNEITVEGWYKEKIK